MDQNNVRCVTTAEDVLKGAYKLVIDVGDSVPDLEPFSSENRTSH